MRINDRVSFGDLAEVFIIDGRQYRSHEACYGPPDRDGGHLESNVSCPERLDANRSLIGAEQEAWLFEGLARASGRWTVLAQDVLIAQLRQPMPHGEGYWTDGWDC